MAYTEIDRPDLYFNTKLYTGNGSTQSIDGVGFRPDWVWLKDRDNANSHKLYDGVRTATKYLISDTTSAEATQSNGLTSFDSDGFTLGSYGGTNGSGNNMVSWNWLASNTTASNTDGSITSTVSANTTSGFSIVSYTGDGSSSATIGHGLGQTPKFIIQKRRDSSTSGDWQVAFKDLGVAYLNFSNAFSTSYGSNGRLNYTGMTSTTYNFGAGTSNVDSVNLSGATYIAYCFAEKKGFSKFGSYTGNGSADGTFVYTGFKPAFVVHKRTDATNNWNCHDNKRSPFNTADERLYLNLSNGEDSGGDYGDDFLSNGFKIRTNEAGWNGSGGSYIYMAFASNPFVTSTGVPTTAR